MSRAPGMLLGRCFPLVTCSPGAGFLPLGDGFALPSLVRIYSQGLVKLELLRKDECGRVRKLLVVLSFFFFSFALFLLLLLLLTKCLLGKLVSLILAAVSCLSSGALQSPSSQRCFWGRFFVLFEGFLLYLPVWVLSVCVSVSVAPCSLGL